MSIKYQILGMPGKDNALIAWINSGTKMYRLLFDCGEDLLKGLNNTDINSIDHLFFSHFHLDHAAGFDFFLRRNYDRSSKPVIIWGPEGTIKIIRNKLRSYTWNLVDELPGKWIINEIHNNIITTSKLYTSEGFSKTHQAGKKVFKNIIFKNKDFTVSAGQLNHIIPSIAYRIDESPALNIDKSILNKIGLPSGPWLNKIKNFSGKTDKKIIINNKTYSIKDLYSKLIRVKNGESITYLTDFVFDKASREKAIKLSKDCQTLVCESQYSAKDSSLAKRNYHLTTTQSAEIAKRAKVKKLILFHISERYKVKDHYSNLLKEAKEVFENSQFPSEWNL